MHAPIDNTFPMTEERIARQGALIVEAIQMFKRKLGLPACTVRFHDCDAELRTKAKVALMDACNGNHSDAWDAVRNPNKHECIRAFLCD